MPIYEYICTRCGEKFSLLRSIQLAEKDINCPHCSSREVKKLVSSFCCGSDSGGSIPAPSGGFPGGG